MKDNDLLGDLGQSGPKCHPIRQSTILASRYTNVLVPLENGNKDSGIPMTRKRTKEMSFRGALKSFIIVFLVLLVMIPIFFVSFSVIQGNEFSPDNFQERTFAYRRIPGTKIRLSSTTLGVSTSPSSKFILNHLPTSGRPTRWQIVDVGNGYSETIGGPKILLNYLKIADSDGAKVWDRWSQKNVQLAAVLWPSVQQAASKEFYWCIPAMLHAAENEFDPTTLDTKLKILCIKAALEKARVIYAKKNGTEASRKVLSEFLSWAEEMAKGKDTDPEISRLLSEFPS